LKFFTSFIDVLSKKPVCALRAKEKSMAKQNKTPAKNDNQKAKGEQSKAVAKTMKMHIPKGSKPDFTPKPVSTVVVQTFEQRCMKASMAYLDMLDGAEGEYMVPIIYNGKNAGVLLIETIELSGNSQESFYGLKVTTSNCDRVKSDLIWHLPISYLRHRELRQKNQPDKLFAWQRELHTALRGMIPGAIAYHFEQYKHKEVEPAPSAVKSNVFDFNPAVSLKLAA
jgi:hypothetical protein